MAKGLTVKSISFIICVFASFEMHGQIKQQTEAWYGHVKDIALPTGYTRIPCDTLSFGFYLRNLELKTTGNEVLLYSGTKKWNQSAQFAVIKMDAGTRDLQQCADAVMRLRAEYLYSQKKFKQIHFNFVSDGKPRYYEQYCKGDYSYKTFRKYLDYIFSYANTASLKKELKKVTGIKEMKTGDVFIQTGNPYGHAVIVMDMAVDIMGNKIFLLAQSYMPAQEIHILVNPTDLKLSPWYRVDFGEILNTPEWTFYKDDLYGFESE